MLDVYLNGCARRGANVQTGFAVGTIAVGRSNPRLFVLTIGQTNVETCLGPSTETWGRNRTAPVGFATVP